MKDKFMKNGVFSLEYDKETLRDMVLELQEENTKLINQQKEFINYLEDEIKIYSNTYMEEMLKELEEILQKYKSIIGVLDENTIK